MDDESLKEVIRLFEIVKAAILDLDTRLWTLENER